MSDHQPVQPQYSALMNDIADGLDNAFNGSVRPSKVGFALFIFEFGEMDDGRVNYISNGSRSDMIIAVREWLARAEGRVQPGGSA